MAIQGKYLHIGCGLKVVEGWENIDSSPSLRISQIPIIGKPFLSLVHRNINWHPIVKYGDVIRGIKIEKNSCKIIYAAHVLEHLSLADFHVALNNIYSYLVVGGVFRFIVPDLESYISAYTVNRQDKDLSPEAAYKFMTETWLGHSRSRKTLYNRFQEAFANSRHQWMWDEPSLVNALSQHGFKDIKRCSYGDWSDSHFQLVESQDKHFNAICIEAFK
jgi:predicted SAM-dependent methyltransferase